MREAHLLTELTCSLHIYKKLFPIRQAINVEENLWDKGVADLLKNTPYPEFITHCLDTQGRLDERAHISSLLPLTNLPVADVLGRIFEAYDIERTGHLATHVLREMLNAIFLGSARLLLLIAEDPESFALPFQPLEGCDISEIRTRIATILDTTKIDSIIHSAARGSLRRQRSQEDTESESEMSYSGESSPSGCSIDAYSTATVDFFTLEDITTCFPLMRRLAQVAQSNWGI